MESLRVAIIGANGKTGRLLLSQILKEQQKREGDKVWQNPVAIVHADEQARHLMDEYHVDSYVFDLEKASVDDLCSILRSTGVNACVFTAGVGTHGGIDQLFTVDLDGCIKVVEACEKVGVQRFIHVSAIRIEDREFWWNLEGLKSYFIAKRSADHFVKSSSLDFTILQPGWLHVGEGTGKVLPLDRINEKSSEGYSLKREDLALSLIHI